MKPDIKVVDIFTKGQNLDLFEHMVRRSWRQLRAKCAYLLLPSLFLCMFVAFPNAGSANIIEIPIIQTSDDGKEVCASVGIVVPSYGVIIVEDHPGGNTSLMASCKNHLKALGRPVELRGSILSAATFLVTIPSACVAPNAVFGFHAPHYPGGIIVPEWRIREIAAEHYTPLLAKYYVSGWGTRMDFTYVRGSEMRKLQISVCSSST